MTQNGPTRDSRHMVVSGPLLLPCPNLLAAPITHRSLPEAETPLIPQPSFHMCLKPCKVQVPGSDQAGTLFTWRKLHRG